MGMLSWIIFGLIAGALAKWIMPGPNPSGCIVTIILGVVTSGFTFLKVGAYNQEIVKGLIIVAAVPMTMQVPALRAMPPSISIHWVWLMLPATPSLPLPPAPVADVGHLTVLSTPTESFQSGDTFAK